MNAPADAVEAALTHRFRSMAPTLTDTQVRALADIALGRVIRPGRPGVQTAFGSPLPTPETTPPAEATMPTTQTIVISPPKPKDRDQVYAELEAAALADRETGQTKEAAVAAFLRTERGRRLYAEYLHAPIPEPAPAPSGLETAPRGADAVYAQHAAMAREAYPDLDAADALVQFYRARPNAYRAYQASLRSGA